MLDYQRLTPHSQAARGKVKALGMLGIHRLTARTPVLGRQKGRYRQRLGSKWAPRYGGFYRQEQISYICIYIYIYVCIYIWTCDYMWFVAVFGAFYFYTLISVGSDQCHVGLGHAGAPLRRRSDWRRRPSTERAVLWVCWDLWAAACGYHIIEYYRSCWIR